MAVAAESGALEPTVAPSGDFEEADRHLKKRLGFTSLLFLSISAIIGSGWLFTVLAAAGIAGPGAILAWVIGGIFVLFVSFSWAEISAMLPRTGGIVRYPYLTHGGFTGWMVGWSYWLSAVTVPAIEAEAVVTYVGGRFPTSGLLQTSLGVAEMKWPLGILFGIGLMFVFFCLNFFGIRLLGEVNRYVTWWKILIPTLTFLLLFFSFKGTNFNAGNKGFLPNGMSAVFFAVSASGIIFSYLGFRQALDYGGESRNPQRDIPLATILSVVIGMVIYTMLQLVFIGAVNWHSGGAAVGDWSGLATGAWSSGPLYDAMQAAGIGALGAFATVLLFDAGISPSGTGWVYLGTSARVNYGLSVTGSLPKALQRPNGFGIPWIALVAAAVVGCVFFIPAPSWYKLVGFITSCTVLTYIMGGLSQIIMRRTAAALHRPYKLKGYLFWSPVGFLAAMMIVYWSGFSTLANVFAAVFLGFPLFVWFYARNKGWVDPMAGAVLGVVFAVVWVLINHFGGWVLTASGNVVPGSWGFGLYDITFSAAVILFTAILWLLCNAEGRYHVQRGLWFIFMVLAIFPVSFYGAFGGECAAGISPSGGSCLAAPGIGFPWDTLIAVGIGLIAFAGGVLSGFETDEMKEIVRHTPSAPTPSMSRPAVLPGAAPGTTPA